MGANTKIEWCDFSFNPWLGCSKISPACDHCYAESWAKRAGSPELWQGERRRTTLGNWRQPLKWNREAQASGTRPRVFCASLADVFDNEVDPQWRADLFGLIRNTPNLDWLLLTKRIGNAARMIEELQEPQTNWWPLSNVWLGATVANQEEAERDIPKLLATPAHVRFLSIEPMLGQIDLLRAGALRTIWWDTTVPGGRAPVGRSVDWVICGGESGSKARPMHPEWARSLRDQCVDAHVPYLFKQWGEWEIASTENGHHGSVMPETGERYTWIAKNGKTFNPSAPNGQDCWAMAKVGKKKSGRLLDGRTWDQFPQRERE